MLSHTFLIKFRATHIYLLQDSNMLSLPQITSQPIIHPHLTSGDSWVAQFPQEEQRWLTGVSWASETSERLDEVHKVPQKPQGLRRHTRGNMRYLRNDSFPSGEVWGSRYPLKSSETYYFPSGHVHTTWESLGPSWDRLLMSSSQNESAKDLVYKSRPLPPLS